MEDNSHTKILNGAMELFNVRGYKRVTMREIARHLRMSSKTLYKHFSSKEDIAEEVIMLLYKDFNEGILKVKKSESDPISNLRQVLSLVKNELITINPLLVRDISLYIPNLQQRLLNGRNEVVQLIEDNIKQGQMAGLFKKEINPEFAARTYYKTLRTLSVPQNDDIYDYSPNDDNSRAKEEMFDFLADIFLAGICENP